MGKFINDYNEVTSEAGKVADPEKREKYLLRCIALKDATIHELRLEVQLLRAEHGVAALKLDHQLRTLVEVGEQLTKARSVPGTWQRAGSHLEAHIHVKVKPRRWWQFWRRK